MVRDSLTRLDVTSHSGDSDRSMHCSCSPYSVQHCHMWALQESPPNAPSNFVPSHQSDAPRRSRKVPTLQLYSASLALTQRLHDCIKFRGKVRSTQLTIDRQGCGMSFSDSYSSSSKKSVISAQRTETILNTVIVSGGQRSSPLFLFKSSPTMRVTRNLHFTLVLARKILHLVRTVSTLSVLVK